MSMPAGPSTSLEEVLVRAGIEPAAYAERSCFLTVVMRTQGLRPRLLGEALASIGEQTDRDLEVIVVRHHTEASAAAAVGSAVAAAPEWLRERVTVLDLGSGARGAPLNLGFERAAGRYVVALDDDDLALPHWVETFRELHEHAPGRVLRTNALRQDVEAVEGDGGIAVREVVAPREAWPREFHLLDHLLMNQTPNMTAAFPREVFHDLGERFDEDLDTTEDWDFLLRAASLLGVTNAEVVTATYRWWVDGGSSHALHDDAQWAANHDRVQRRLDERVLLLPHGTVQRLQELVELPRITLAEVTAERDRLAAANAGLEEQVTTLRKKLTRKRRQLEQQPPPARKPGLFGRERG